MNINILHKYFVLNVFGVCLFASNIEPVKNFNSYPLAKEATSISRGGTLNDKSASEDGIGTVLIGGIGKESNDINNKSYNKALKQNSSTLSDTTNLKDLPINSNDLNSMNNNKFVKLNNVNGTTCNDNDSQTIDETWLNDICQGGTPLHLDGEICNDGNSETVNEKFLNNVCIDKKINDTTCNDNDSNTNDDVWLNGVCSGIQLNGPCEDGHSETINDFMKDGVCLSGELTKITNKNMVMYKTANFSSNNYYSYTGNSTTLFNNNINGSDYFYWNNGFNYIEINVESDFRIWSIQGSLSDYLSYDAQLQFTNVNTGIIIKSTVSDYGRNTSEWRQVSQTIPSGKYRVGTFGPSHKDNISHYRLDSEWFIEKINKNN